MGNEWRMAFFSPPVFLPKRCFFLLLPVACYGQHMRIRNERKRTGKFCLPPPPLPTTPFKVMQDRKKIKDPKKRRGKSPMDSMAALTDGRVASEEEKGLSSWELPLPPLLPMPENVSIERRSKEKAKTPGVVVVVCCCCCCRSRVR